MQTCTTQELLEQAKSEIRPLIEALVELPNFERLARISFLGAIERFGPRESSRSAQSRFQHSIGVANLVLLLDRKIDLSDGEFRVAIVHALLHDIGHGPFSHSCEEFFRAKFHIDHHTYLINTIENADSRESQVLRHFGLWLDYRNFLRSPEKIPAVEELFFGPINVDTIEGILRASEFFGLSKSIDRDSLAGAISSRPLKLRQLDEFWMLKGTVYNECIFSSEQARYDALICDALFLVTDEVSISDFRLDDETFEERYHRAIFHQLNLANAAFKAPEKRERNFIINDVEKPARVENLKGRYFELKGEKCKQRLMLSSDTNTLRRKKSKN